MNVKKSGLEPILGAAYLLTDRAYVRLEGDRTKRIKASLSLKEPSSPGELKKLAAAFQSELEAQIVRWAIAKNNLPIREYIAEQAVLLANGRALPAPQETAGDQLTQVQRDEIEKLIAEVEQEIKMINEKKSASDPKKISASWEEKQETRLRGANS